MTDFKRENRYYVVKLKDLEPDADTALLKWDEKWGDKMPQRSYVVVESDWPEYEIVWKMIEARVNGDKLVGDVEPVATVDADGFLVVLKGDYIPSGMKLVPASALAAAQQEVAKLHKAMEVYDAALDEWSDKTEWVQKTVQPGELGMHRADVLRQRIEAEQAKSTQCP